MRGSWVGVALAGVVAAGSTAAVIGSAQTPGRAPARTHRRTTTVRAMPAHTTTPRRHTTAPAALKQVVDYYCVVCHDDDLKKGELSLESFDPAHAEAHPEIAEKMIRKLRAGMMPPAGQERPDQPTLDALVSTLETRLDETEAARINPGQRTFQRLNRAEYVASIHDLLGLDVDVSAFLPADTISHNFDNIADVQSMSPTLLEGYLRAAASISRDAVGDPEAAPSSTIYKTPRTGSQLTHIDGAPFGTRGGIVVTHTFPADGEYTFRVMLHSIPTGQLYGSTVKGELLEVSINGVRAAVMEINPRMSESDPNGMNLETPPIAVRAGPQRIAAAFVQRWDGPVDDLLAPVEQTLADTQIGSATGITTLPHVRELAILGPTHVTGVSDTPSRRLIFSCRPLAPADEIPCASRILTTLGRKAYRHPLTPDDLEGLLTFYTEGRARGNFETGIRTALQALLASPQFIFRLEEIPPGVRAGQVYPIGSMDLASRLSFFLWAAPPDDQLLNAASKGLLATPAGLDAQVRRMLGDPRAGALATRFAAQWLRLQDIDKIHPDPLLYRAFDNSLARAMRRETELLFERIVREDRDVLELLTADYAYVNERLARHYGIPNVTGDEFQLVHLADENRRGILGEGSILMMTSVADRTSPVLRGKWILEVLFGMPPPPPPPGIPAFDETKSSAGGHLLSVRERMEAHRANPACRSCHRVIDPLGLALENFDVTGQWRIRDGDAAVDPSGTLYDGTPLGGPIALRRALLEHHETVLRTFTENLMAYALGRRVEYYDMPTVRAIVRDADAKQDRFSTFVLGIVNSPAFRMAKATALTH